MKTFQNLQIARIRSRGKFWGFPPHRSAQKALKKHSRNEYLMILLSECRKLPFQDKEAGEWENDEETFISHFPFAFSSQHHRLSHQDLPDSHFSTSTFLHITFPQSSRPSRNTESIAFFPFLLFIDSNRHFVVPSERTAKGELQFFHLWLECRVSERNKWTKLGKVFDARKAIKLYWKKLSQPNFIFYCSVRIFDRRFYFVYPQTLNNPWNVTQFANNCESFSE